MRFSDSHEWAELNEGIATIGITDFAIQELGEIVFVELPKKGTALKAGEEAVVVESTKAAADIYSPLSGVVVEANSTLASDPQKINHAPMKEGWLFKVKVPTSNEYDQLMDESTYKKFIQE